MYATGERERVHSAHALSREAVSGGNGATSGTEVAQIEAPGRQKAGLSPVGAAGEHHGSATANLERTQAVLPEEWVYLTSVSVLSLALVLLILIWGAWAWRHTAPR